MKARSRPVARHCSMRLASSRVAWSVPRSSSTIFRQPRGRAARTRFASASSTRSTGRPAPRVSGLRAINSRRASRGMRRAYSSNPASTHAGILWPIATMTTLMPGAISAGGLPFLAAAGRRRRRGPQFFQVIVLADGGLHDVHDDLTDIHQYPLAGLLSFDAVDLRSQRLQLFLNVVGESPALTGGIGARNDDLVEQRGHALYVEDHDVARLDVFQRRDGGIDQLVFSHRPPE